MPHSQAESTQLPALIPISSRSILILSSQAFPKVSFLQVYLLKFLKSTPTFLHSGYMTSPSRSSRHNYPDYIRRTVQTIQLLIVEPSPLPILIPLEPKYIRNKPTNMIQCKIKMDKALVGLHMTLIYCNRESNTNKTPDVIFGFYAQKLTRNCILFSGG